MLPADISVLSKVIRIQLNKGHCRLSQSHEQIVNNSIYNSAIHDVLELLEGIENGTIDQQAIKQLVSKEE